LVQRFNLVLTLDAVLHILCKVTGMKVREILDDIHTDHIGPQDSPFKEFLGRFPIFIHKNQMI